MRVFSQVEVGVSGGKVESMAKYLFSAPSQLQVNDTGKAYEFSTGRPEWDSRALALGLACMYNHSITSANVSWDAHFQGDRLFYTFSAKEDIEAGAELRHNYGWDGLKK